MSNTRNPQYTFVSFVSGSLLAAHIFRASPHAHHRWSSYHTHCAVNPQPFNNAFTRAIEEAKEDGHEFV